MTTDNKSKLSAPLYAAAGAGDALYQRLRKVEFDKLAEFAQAAQQRAVEVYYDLVARGERVVAARGAAGNGRSPAVESGAAKRPARPAATASK